MTSGDSDQQPTASLVITGRPPSALVTPVTGDRLERLRGDGVRVGAGHIEVSDGDDVEVFDFELNSVLGPEAVGDADAVAFDGIDLVIAEGDVVVHG